MRNGAKYSQSISTLFFGTFKVFFGTITAS